MFNIYFIKVPKKKHENFKAFRNINTIYISAKRLNNTIRSKRLAFHPLFFLSNKYKLIAMDYMYNRFKNLKESFKDYQAYASGYDPHQYTNAFNEYYIDDYEVLSTDTCIDEYYTDDCVMYIEEYDMNMDEYDMDIDEYDFDNDEYDTDILSPATTCIDILPINKTLLFLTLLKLESK
ncbi:hypothetical protein BDF21DRAFT_450736 [Thamnidium elegans]|nr:hypothetical protein BDF21DRAFT_450736 [Thamnidium elegans]